MTNDFSTEFAVDLAEYLSQGTALPQTPPDPIYVALFDDTGTEVSGDFANGRVATAAGTDWNLAGETFTNANDIAFGEATVDVNSIEAVGLWDASGVGLGYEFINGVLDDADVPFDVADGSTLTINAGEFSTEILD